MSNNLVRIKDENIINKELMQSITLDKRRSEKNICGNQV
jgi:hypothetical protein